MDETDASGQQAASDLDRVAITLSTIAYLAVDGSPEERFRAMAQALQIPNLPTARQWGLVWGPHEHDQSLVFVAQGPVVDGRRLYAVVFRGTVDSIYDFFFDLDVWGQSAMPWTDPEFPGAKLADGTIDDWDDIRNLYQSPGGRRQTLPDFLRGVDAGSQVIVTGHSLGGNMATAMTDWLRVELNVPVPHVRLQPITFAAPTSGNAAFAEPYLRVFPGSRHFVNNLDVVPRAWAYSDLESIKSLYPGFGAPKCDDINGCRLLIDTALDFVGHEYLQPDKRVVLNSRLYSESGLLDFYDEALAQHSSLLYMYLTGIPLAAIQALYPQLRWQPPPGL
jgi:triacylglycerol lipase